MTSIEELIKQIKSYNSNADFDLIKKSYNYGFNAHKGQYRASGEIYFTHPVEVAKILIDLKLDESTIKTALLHDTIEDTSRSLKQLELAFGKEVSQLVDGVTKLTNLELSSLETKHAENFRKLFMAMSKDVRVLLVKLADRLHNMRTIKALPIDKQIRKSKETMEIFAPLAGRMGMQFMREELEDLSFRVLNSEARNSIIRRFITLRKETDDLVPKIIDDIKQQLKKENINAIVTGREKSLIPFGEKCNIKRKVLQDFLTSLLLELLLKMRLMHILQWVQFIGDGEQSQEILKIILVTLRVMVIDQFILQSLEEMEKELKFKLELKK